MATNPASLFPMPPSAFARDPALLLQGVQQPALPQLPAPPQAALAAMQQLAPPEPVRVESAMEKLGGPETERHKAVLQKLVAMKKFSRDEMRKHYNRWNFGEQRIQAYASVTDYEQVVQSLAQKGAQPPEPFQVIVPYSYATLHAAATFIANVLLGRKPLFPLLGVRRTSADAARYMEQAIQSNMDASRGQEELWQFIWDSLIYGFGITRIGWDERRGPAIRWVNGQREQSEELVFSGNSITCVDPYGFYPDPRVPIHQCNVKGDFMFTEQEQSESVLRDLERAGILKYVQEALGKAKNARRDEPANQESRRRVKIGIRGEYLQTPTNVTGFAKVFEGTVRLSAKDWKLGDKEESELWKFTFTDQVILQAEPLGMLHGMHPYTASEPTSFGHDFMSVAMSDMIGPFQDILSWLVSSRMENVRTAINNQFVVDPARVEVNDIRSSTIGRIIRLKQAAMGLPVQEAIMQLTTMDMTSGHLSDIQTMRVLADTITGVNDNMRGIQTAGGRRSATEARMSMQAGASRLSQMAIRISSQGFLPMVNQMIMNVQQFMPDEMWIETTGDDAQPSSMALTPDMLIGHFNYQVSDGSLPFDKMAMVESWKEILFGIARDPELRQQYDLGRIFQYVAELGGAKNIDSFKRQQQPNIAMGAAPAPGMDPNMVPLGPAQPALPMNLG